MPASLSEWDARHQAAEGASPEPASFVRELLPLLPTGPALDLACGTGRHTLLLASRGQAVTAVDGSGVALDVLERRARELQYGVSRIGDSGRIVGSSREIQLVRTDLEHATLAASSFSLILCVHYLQRSLFAPMQAALLPGGMLLFETYTRAQIESAGGPKNPAYLLEIGELRTAFPRLRIVFYRELRPGKGIASLIAERAG
jgi:SAM-dependent methyltransferase